MENLRCAIRLPPPPLHCMGLCVRDSGRGLNVAKRARIEPCSGTDDSCVGLGEAGEKNGESSEIPERENKARDESQTMHPVMTFAWMTNESI